MRFQQNSNSEPLVFVTNTVTNWAIAHSKIQVYRPGVMIVRLLESNEQQWLIVIYLSIDSVLY